MVEVPVRDVPAATLGSVTRRQIAAAAFAVALCGVLTACDPGGLPDGANSAGLYVTIGAQGGAQGEISIDAGTRSHAELTQLGQEVGLLLFPDATTRIVTVDDATSFQAAFVTISAKGVYQPGPHAGFQLDTRPAVAALLRAGPTSIDIEVIAPPVPSTGAWSPAADAEGGDWYWPSITNQQAAPVGVVLMKPRPWRATTGLAATALVWLLAVVAIVAAARRRRTRAILVGTGLVVVAFVSAIWPGFQVSEDLGVSGWLSGPALSVATWAPVSLVPAGLLGIVVVIVALVLGKAPAPMRFNPPPGWPAPPDGWLPPQGWRSDPSWPPAPEGWRFLVPVAEPRPDASSTE